MYKTILNRRMYAVLLTILIIRAGAATPTDCTDHEKRIGVLEERVHRLEKALNTLLYANEVKERDTEDYHVRREILSGDKEGIESLLSKAAGLPGRDGLPGSPGVQGVQGPPGPPGTPGNCSMLCQDPAPYKKYYSQENIENHLKVSNLPAMSEFTACFYFGPNGYGSIDALTGKGARIQWLMGISSAAYDNEFSLIFRPKEGVGAWNKKPVFGDHLDAFREPHRHCFVWKSGAYMKWFYDKNSPGQLELVGQIAESGQKIPADSILILLNDQDSHGGKLEFNQMTPGNIADFQMWNRAFSDGEVAGLGCAEVGNVVTFSDIDTVGLANFMHGGDFQCSR